MHIQPLGIPDIKIITPKKFVDDRGFFSETYNKKSLSEQGIHIDFVQDNHAYSALAYTMRGLHFQIPPLAQDKLVRVIRGSILDVVVDIRSGSPYYGQHVSIRISAAEWNQILVPAGFAHGMMTLEEHTEVIYKVSNYYAPEHDQGLLWNDPDLGIKWPVDQDTAILSDKDRRHPRLRDLPKYFEH